MGLGTRCAASLCARFSATTCVPCSAQSGLTPVCDRATSISRADTQPAVSLQLPAPNRESSHALARASGVRMVPRFDNASHFGALHQWCSYGVSSVMGLSVSPPATRARTQAQFNPQHRVRRRFGSRRRPPFCCSIAIPTGRSADLIWFRRRLNACAPRGHPRVFATPVPTRSVSSSCSAVGVPSQT